MPIEDVQASIDQGLLDDAGDDDEYEDYDDDEEFADDEEPAEFSSGVIEFCPAGSPCKASGDVVRRKGVIFRSGVYPGQRFAMTPAELRELAANFTAVPIDAGHPSAPSPLDNKLGQLESVEMGADGQTLLGVVAFPRWLEERLGDARRMVSATFNRSTRRLKSLSLVMNPAITDAELVAFAAGRPSGVIHAPAAFTRPEKTAMYETPEQKRARLDRHLANTDLGRAVLSGAARPLSESTRLHLKGTPEGRAVLAARDDAATFSGVAGAPPAVATPGYHSGPSDLAIKGMIDAVPVEPGDESEAALLRAAWEADGPALVAAIRERIASIESYADARPHSARMGGVAAIWPPGLRADAHWWVRLRHMLRALEGGKPGKPLAYAGPTRGERMEGHGRLVARAAMRSGLYKLSDLIGQANGRRGRVPSGRPPAEAMASYATAFARSKGPGLAEAHQEAHRGMAREADAYAESSALAALLDGDALATALGLAAGKAIAAAGGEESVARDYADRRAMEPRPADPDESALATVAAELKTAGVTADTPDAGRAVRELQARHRALSDAVDRHRTEGRDAVKAEAAQVVSEALAGRHSPLQKLIDAAAESPRAFADGFAAAIKATPLEALEELPAGGFCNVLL